eukprot:658870-Pleurochrysis_carterae.AAC.1
MNVTQRRPGVAVAVALHAHDIGHGYYMQMRSRATAPWHTPRPSMHRAYACIMRTIINVRISCTRTLTPEGAVIFRDLARARGTSWVSCIIDKMDGNKNKVP